MKKKKKKKFLCLFNMQLIVIYHGIFQIQLYNEFEKKITTFHFKISLLFQHGKKFNHYLLF